jgi:NAD(P)-dependent dehydrogenase (short-subunit alcohol dehydrogenase family)
VPTVLITGAGRGLGYEFARQYAADGWKVIGTVRSAKAKAALAKLRVEAPIADVTEGKSIARLAQDLKGTPIDVLVCNAGIYGPRRQTFGKLDYAAWETVLGVNVLGATAVAEALLENVAASDRRIMVMMSSRLGSIAESRGGDYLYASSKAALNMIAKALSVTLAKRGITVVSVVPGWVRTDMGGKSAPLTPETSVRGLRKVIAGLSLEKSGGFFSYDGSAVPW